MGVDARLASVTEYPVPGGWRGEWIAKDPPPH